MILFGRATYEEGTTQVISSSTTTERPNSSAINNNRKKRKRSDQSGLKVKMKDSDTQTIGTDTKDCGTQTNNMKKHDALDLMFLCVKEKDIECKEGELYGWTRINNEAPRVK